MMLRLNESKFIAAKLARNYVSKSKNLYDVLGITPHATHSDIKTAYYKLSKIHHPDMNKDDKIASEKFRILTEAYEVLGNYRLRKLYDKGIIHTAGKEFAKHAEPVKRTQAYDVESEHNDDDTTKFYKSRLKREHTGQSRVYDFDEWTRQHYSDTFSKRKANKTRIDSKRTRDANFIEVKVTRSTVFYIMAIIICLAIIAEYITKHISHDIVDPKISLKYKKKEEEDRDN